MAQFAFYYDNSRCTGCKTCVMACKDYYDSPIGVAYRKVYDIVGGTWNKHDDGSYDTDTFLYHLSLGCQHCDNPACVPVCPTTAMHKDYNDQGIVKIDETKCIGCGFCVIACPYNVPQIDRDAGHAVKCEACYQRLAEGKEPICVSSCPLRALEFGDIDELRKAHPNGVNQIHPMPSPDITHPNIVIKPSPAASASTASSGLIANPEEVD